MKYRPEIDGLRAIAVLAVVLYHADLGVRGGYVGVDVFFVISGYLITSLIVRDLQLGTFSLVGFWERRVRRIMPAALTVILATLVAGWFLLLPSDYEDLGYSALSQLAFSANVYFWKTTNYFAGASEEKPLLHTWSLAVEEQFYLLLPFILLAAFKLPVARRKAALWVVLSLGFLVSFSLSVWGQSRMPTATFYLLPGRAWELLLGSIVALLPRPSAGRLATITADALALLGLGMILVACFVFNAETPFPGAAALLPCVGASLFIFGTSDPSRRGYASRIMSTAPIIFIGLISYSLYLWHWPLFAFTAYWSVGELALWTRLTLVLVSALLAYLSWRFVETPFRLRNCADRRVVLFSYAGIGVVACAFAALLAVGNMQFSGRMSDALMTIDAAKVESLPRNRLAEETDLSEAKNGQFPRFGAAEPAPVSLLVWGDSLARTILPAAAKWGARSGTGVLSVWHSGSPPVCNYIPPSPYSLSRDCPEFTASVIEWVKRSHIPKVLLVGWWSEYLRSADTLDKQNAFLDSLRNTVLALRAAGAEVWIMQEFPRHDENPLKALRCLEMFGPRSVPTHWQATAKSHDKACALLRSYSDSLTSAGARIIDPSTLLFDASTGKYQVEIDGIPLYYDEIHLTRAGAEFIGSSLEELYGNIHPAAIRASSHP
jgi:peptidoglycan/LPS O-acetylase OafA/YrhL